MNESTNACLPHDLYTPTYTHTHCTLWIASVDIHHHQVVDDSGKLIANTSATDLKQFLRDPSLTLDISVLEFISRVRRLSHDTLLGRNTRGALCIPVKVQPLLSGCGKTFFCTFLWCWYRRAPVYANRDTCACHAVGVTDRCANTMCKRSTRLWACPRATLCHTSSASWRLPVCIACLLSRRDAQRPLLV